MVSLNVRLKIKKKGEMYQQTEPRQHQVVLVCCQMDQQPKLRLSEVLQKDQIAFSKVLDLYVCVCVSEREREREKEKTPRARRGSFVSVARWIRRRSSA